MPSLRCKSREGRLGPPGRQPMLSSGSCAWRQVSRAFRFQKRSALGGKNIPSLTSGSNSVQATPQAQGWEYKGKRWLSQEELARHIGSRWDFSWKHTEAAELQEHWGFLDLLSGGWINRIKENGGQVVWTEGKGDRIRRSKEEVTMEGHIPDLSRDWKSSTKRIPRCH